MLAKNDLEPVKTRPVGIFATLSVPSWKESRMRVSTAATTRSPILV
jgi:hypothetical protein